MTILFFHFDGTCNDPTDAALYHEQDSSITNVLKSHFLLGGRLSSGSCMTRLPSGGVSFYYSGVGTYGSNLARYVNAGFAVENGDVATILRAALVDFQCYYHSEVSNIVLIGFSRGAALARRFAALIDGFLDRAIVIEAVMDTVASIGWPNLDPSQRPKQEVVFEYGHTLPRCVRQALHLVALDEQRLAFRPTLMNQDERVEEVWLTGVHSDIGGGYRKDGLADISLMTIIVWLQQQLGVYFYETLERLGINQISGAYDILKIRPTHLGKVHYQSRLSWSTRLTLAPRHCCVLINGKPCQESSPYWHSSVLERVSVKPSYQPIAFCSAPVVVWGENVNIDGVV